MSRFALALAGSGIINQLAIYALVHWALDSLGAEAVGKWMAMNRLADAFNVPLLAVANSILLPTLAGLSANIPGLKDFIRPIFRQSLLWLALGFLALWALYPLLLRLLFSDEFTADPALLPWQMAGDFFRSSTCVFAVVMLALGHTRFYFWLETASALLVLAGSIFLFPRFGFACLFITHAIRYALYWLAIVLRYRNIFF
jgi:PST family polysaccharide transporter